MRNEGELYIFPTHLVTHVDVISENLTRKLPFNARKKRRQKLRLKL